MRQKEINPPKFYSIVVDFERLIHCAITVPDLDLFLARHPTIRTLELPFHPAIGALSPPAAVCLLPHLTTLSTTPDYLLYFLAGPAAAGWYPTLRYVGVTSHEESAYQLGQFARLLECIEARTVVPRMVTVGRLASCCDVPVKRCAKQYA
jgi:hypothetical protein